MKKIRKIYSTDFLLPKNNFLVGIGSVLNLSDAYFEYNYSKSDIEADFKALYSDWQNIGNDIEKSIKKFETENSQELCPKY